MDLAEHHDLTPLQQAQFQLVHERFSRLLLFRPWRIGLFRLVEGMGAMAHVLPPLKYRAESRATSGTLKPRAVCGQKKRAAGISCGPSECEIVWMESVRSPCPRREAFAGRSLSSLASRRPSPPW